MDELLKLLKIRTGPDSNGKEFINMCCGVAFEPHGKASEDWDVYWVLTLPQIRSHWKSNSGWKKRDNPSLLMKFKGKTFNEVVTKAKKFLEEINNEKGE